MHAENHTRQIQRGKPPIKISQLLAFGGVDANAAVLRFQNLISRLRKQSRAHAVNAILLILAISLLLFWQGKTHSLAPPQWLHGFEMHVSTALVLMMLGAIFVRFIRGVTSFQGDWLSVQPIATAQRMAWLRTKIAAHLSVELIGSSFLAAWLCGVNYGMGVFGIGAGLSLITLMLLPYWQTRQAKNARHPISSVQSNRQLTTKIQANTAIARVKITETEPFGAWFASAIPRLSRLRWWWLIPLLSLPMGSKIVLIAAIFASFLALSRFASVCSALSIALADISKLTQTTPLRPVKLYRAGIIFSAQGALILTVVAIALALSPAGFGIAVIVAGVGIALLGTALHFGFGYRLEPQNSARRNRASIMIALLFGITANSLPIALPVVCALLWFWLYRRGTRLINSKFH